MSSPKRRRAPNECELCSLSDFHLLHKFTDLVCEEHSLEAKAVACEIMRRYTSARVETQSATNGDPSTLGSSRWGDATRVYEIFGIKRGPLDRLRRVGLIKSSSLEEGKDGDVVSAVRAKRLYDLISIEQFLRSQKSKERCHATQFRNNRNGSKLKVMDKQ